MATINPNAATVYRDFVTDGVPSSGSNDPNKAQIRTLLGIYEAAIAAISNQRSITTPTDLVVDKSGVLDGTMNINLVSPGTLALPLSSTMNGRRLTINVLNGSAAVTLQANVSETNGISGQTTLVVAANQTVTVAALNDGTNTGYLLQ